MEKEERHKIAYDLGTTLPDNVFDRYDQHAEKYSEFYTGLGIPDHAHLAKYLTERGFPKDTPILDAGCGTGLTVQALAKEGFNNVVGIDGSAGMVEEAKKLGLYKDAIVGFIGMGKFPEELKGKFKVAVTAGTFIVSHFPSVAVDEVMFEGFTGEKGDSFISVIRDDCYEPLGHKEHIYKLQEQGKIKVVNEIVFERQIESTQFSDPLYGSKSNSIIVHLELC